MYYNVDLRLLHERERGRSRLFSFFPSRHALLSFPAGRKLLKFKSQSKPRRNGVKELFRRVLVVVTHSGMRSSVLLPYFPRDTRAYRRHARATSYPSYSRIRARDRIDLLAMPGRWREFMYIKRMRFTRTKGDV